MLNKAFTVHRNLFIQSKIKRITSSQPLKSALLYWSSPTVLRDGDILHVHSNDRLARNLMDLQKLVEEFNEKGVSIQFYKENLVFSHDSSSPMVQLQLQMLGAFAQFERSKSSFTPKRG